MPIKWVDSPPPPRPGRKPANRPKYYAFAEALRKNPGKWGVLGDDINTALAWQIRSGKVVAFQPAGHFEAVCRATGKELKKSRGTVYVRFLGPQEPEVDA